MALHPQDMRNLAVPMRAPTWLLPAVTIIGMVSLFGLVIWTSPTAEDRFDRCMALAERGRLLEARREEAALICLRNATRRRGDGPIVIPSSSGGAPIVIP